MVRAADVELGLEKKALKSDEAERANNVYLASGGSTIAN